MNETFPDNAEVPSTTILDCWAHPFVTGGSLEEPVVGTGGLAVDGVAGESDDARMSDARHDR